VHADVGNQVAALRGRVDQLEGRLAASEASNQALAAKVQELGGEAGHLRTQLAEANAQAARANERLDQLLAVWNGNCDGDYRTKEPGYTDAVTAEHRFGHFLSCGAWRRGGHGIFTCGTFHEWQLAQDAAIAEAKAAIAATDAQLDATDARLRGLLEGWRSAPAVADVDVTAQPAVAASVEAMQGLAAYAVRGAWRPDTAVGAAAALHAKLDAMQTQIMALAARPSRTPSSSPFANRRPSPPPRPR
jgi:uncharacterized coiled-coil protein SlyX